MNHAAYRQTNGAGASFGPIPGGLRVTLLVTAIVETIAFVGAIAAWIVMFATIDRRPHQEPSAFNVGFVLGSYGLLVLALFTTGIVGILWVHKAWSWIPMDQRYTKMWRSWISPAQASLFLLIPYFHYYWMFVVNLGICDALDRLRVMYPTREPAPRQIAIAACILQIVFWPAAGFFFHAFAKKVEQMTKEMSESASARRALGY